MGESSPDATEPTTMVACPSPSDQRSRKPTTVASPLALHLDCSRTYIGKLEAEGVIQRQGDGFLLDQSRVAYQRYLRLERRPSPREEAERCLRNGMALAGTPNHTD